MRGRPKGSKSFIKICLDELNNMLPSNSTIPVSRVWVDKLNSAGVSLKVEAEEKPSDDDKVEMTLKQ